MDRPRDFLLFLLLLQIGTKEVLGHSNEGKMGDIEIKCPSGSFFYEGYCFMVGSVPMTWEDAMTSCLRSGMYLSWIEDAIENNYVATHAMSRVSQYWIGLSNMSSTAGQNEIVWTQYRMMKNKALPLVEGLWKNLQPSEFVGDSQCVSTLRDKDDNHWTVTNCRKKLPFICKVLGAPKSPDSMYCGNGGYINQKWQCDGQNDCGDMSDEVNCSSSCTELKIVQKGGSGTITMVNGSQQSPTYKNDAFCTWTLKAPIGVRIKVTINSTTDLEENADVLSVWTGGITLKESNFLGSVTGRPGKTQEFYSQNNYLILQLSMDHTVINNGFTADFETVDETKIWNNEKMLNASSSWQTLESPVYGQAVPFGLQLEWLITAESYTVVSLEFTVVDLPTDGSLKVYDGEDLMAPLVFSITETPEHPFYISQSKTVRIVLSTNIHEYGKYRGVQLKYKEGCMLDLTQQGKIYSPGYQINSYPSNVTCTWHIHKKSGETRPISLRFTDFKLKNNSDYVEIYNDTAGTALHTGSGLTGLDTVSNAVIFSSTDGHLNVTFKSNLVLVEKGFSADFSIDCPILTISQWTVNSVSGKYTALNTVITLSCQTGYSFKQEEYNKESSVSLKCLHGGMWNVSRIPDCQITYCGTPPAIPNGILKNATGPKVGDNATYECDGGFTMNVSPTIKCQANGMWEIPPVCNAQQCPSINPPSNGKVNETAGNGTNYATVLMFSCNPGYDLLGSVYINCRSNGTWSHPTPTCQEIKCPIPQVMYGKVEAAGDVAFKGTAKLKCDTGFIVNGTSSGEKDVTCGSDGQFSNLDPCINEDECSSGSPCQGSSNTECIDTIGSYICKCNNGFNRTGETGSCTDINECNDENGGCSQRCNNYVGSFNCSCNPGYQLYLEPNFNNISLADGETGTRAGDKIRINYTCVRALCPTLSPPMNGTILSKKKLFYYEDEITVECNHGYYPNPQRTTLKCGVEQGVGKWSEDMINCTKGTCMTPDFNTDPNYNKIFPNENASVEFGTHVIIECKYGTKFRNLSLYCGESGTSTYRLLGDNLTCPVIDCGTPEQVPGADVYSYSDSLFGSSFNFSCQNGSTLSGKSVDGDYTVRCQENRQWGFGNLTCTGGRCTDPGTPGGAVQVVRSYEAGELLRFKCIRQGYEPVPSAPLLCVEQGSRNASWNATALPLCTDVTPPEFNNCPKTIYTDSMEAVSFVTPTATDNSGLVKNVTVDPPNFKSGTVVSRDLNVTYTAVDNGGNTARCTISFIIKDRRKPDLMCPNITTISMNSKEGITVDLSTLIPGNATYSPRQFINVNVSTLDKPQQVTATERNMWGTENTCTFLIYTKAGVCLTDSLPSALNAEKNCNSSGGNKTCTYTCKSGYVYFDGATSKTYTCSGMNIWSPSINPEGCLSTESPSYKAEFEVVYDLGKLASSCEQGFDSSLAEHNTSIAGIVREKCSHLDSVNFVINSFTSTSSTFQITTVFSGEFTGSASDEIRFLCLQTVYATVNRKPYTFLHNNTTLCDGGTQSSVSVLSIKGIDAGNKCADNMVLIKLNSGSGEQCVMCPPGRYFNGSSCVMCADGQYQDLVGQTSCKTCPYNTVSIDNKLVCKALCPPGFTSSDGITECKPCGRDEYWVNATNCENCPAGYKTDVQNGVPDVRGCKAPCVPGKYSLTGYEPCEDCPLHHYQTAQGQTHCTECPQDQRTLLIGSNSSVDCATVDSRECNTTLKNCSDQGKCVFRNHEASCLCDEGYIGLLCETAVDVCQSNPCFNNGTCVQVGNGFNCTCPSNANCTMQNIPGNLVVDDDKSEYHGEMSLDSCKEKCLEDVQCKAMYHTKNNCFIVKQDAPTLPYGSTSQYFFKSCLYEYLYGGNQCETDLEDECTPDTCSSHGMCQDRAGKDPVCLCPIVGEYSQPKCDLVQNLCSPDPCKNGAECRSWGAVRRQCICKPGFTGVNCSVNINDCAVNTDGCLYNSTCRDGVDSYTCDCTSGFSDRHCQVTKDFCSGSPCPNGGCVNDYTKLSPKCFCDYSYQLGNGQCEKMDLCNNTVCINGTCNPLIGKCSCDLGFEGSSCQHSVDECKEMPCKNGSTCIDAHQDYSCVCASGFEGKNCDVNKNDCPGSCNNATTRDKVDKINECECLCKPGYTGKNCTEEVDECARFPCKHGANCTDMLNDYRCNCTEGWEGKNCDQQINYCHTTSTKCQSGDCYNLIDDKYCRCNAGTRGDTCEEIPDVCNVISPCTAMGTCQNANGTATCSCQNNYTGDSCQLLEDFCTGTTNCLYQDMPNTGGTCTNLPAGGFNCACQTGYSGGTCQTKVTHCSTLNCGSIAMCNEEIGCYCPEGKILTDNKVCKTPSDDFDILFDTSIGEEGASTTAVIPGDSEKTDLSFMMWVKFNKGQKETEDAVLLRIGDVLEIKNNTITFMNRTTSRTVYIGFEELPFRLDNGNWNFIAVSWKRNGDTLVLVEGVLIFEDSSVTFELPEVFKVEVGKKFGGRLSQIKIWNSSLTDDDMFKLPSNRNYKPAGATLIQGWYNYKMSKGAVKKVTSQIDNDTVCDVPACSQLDKIKPKIKACTGDDVKNSTNRVFNYQLPAISSMFDNFSESLSLMSHNKTDSFTWGDYSLLFMAADENENTAMCLSKLYVKYNAECPEPRTRPSSLNILYCSGSRDICNLGCSDNQELSIPAPKFKMCSKLGVYTPLKPHKKYVLPSCGNKTETQIQIEVSLRFSLAAPCGDILERSMKTNLMSHFQDKVYQDWNNVCTTSDCLNVDIVPKCAGNTEMITTMKISNLRNGITKKQGSSDAYTAKEVFRVLIFEETVFEVDKIGGAKLLNDQVVITDIVSCPDGNMIIRDNCVVCSQGTYYNSTSQNCEYCPVGTYGDEEGMTSCKVCVPGKTTLGVGNYEIAGCVESCLVGQFLNFTKCAPCQKHFYQDMAGMDYCLPCPLGKKTSGVGSNSSSQCFDDCAEGTELKPDGQCVECPRGYYRSFLEDVCTPCTAGITTAGNGTTNAFKCTIKICNNGTYRNTSNVCVPCPVGEYQPMDLQEKCIKCPVNFTTESDGTSFKSDCKFYCPAGYEVLHSANETCRPCPRGQYKNNTDVFSRCSACPSGLTTKKMKTTTIDECTITICNNGTYRNTSNVCVPCPVGEYQPMDLQEKCIKCPVNFTTESDGTSSKSDCKFYCPAGYEVLHSANETCRPCPRGQYKNNTDVFSRCSACPSGNTTESMKTTSINDCSINICSSGQEIGSSGGCVDCELDYYQSVDVPTSENKCKACPAATGTKQKMSNSSSNCLNVCSQGQFFNSTSNACEQCPKGTWNNGNFTMKFEGCTNCPVNYTTTGPGMISEDNCTLLDCSPGSYISGNYCLPCDFATYQPDRHQISCEECGQDLNTSSTGATSEKDCQIFCPAGEEGQEACKPCENGYVKELPGITPCRKCTGNYTSNDQRTDCDKLFCDMGFSFDQNSCIPCSVGYYKADRGNTNCTKCPDGFLTTIEASVSADDCSDPYCIPGKYINSTGQCDDCMIGYYKTTTGNNNCTACSRNYTTPSRGSTLASNCSIIVCEAGEKRISSNNTCIKCPVGSYQPDRGQSDCLQCSAMQTTEQEGTVNQKDCVPICPPGEEFNSTSKTCGKCALGYYKSTTGNSEPCTKCPDGNTTLVIGSVSSAACNISDCLPGTYRSSGAGCKECPAGTFQDEKSQTSCQKCPANKNITETTGATSDSYCIVSCGDGSQYDRTLDNCTACPKDFYTNRKISQYCIKCPSGFITYGAGSSECVPQAPGTTAAPVIKQQTFIFTLSYKLFLDCQVPDAVNSALANIRARIIHRLLALASRFANFCRKINVQECFLSVRVQSNVCKTARRKKRNASPVDLDVKVDIPDVSSTVTDTEEPTKILQTESMLKEDLDTNKPEYAPQGTELVSSRFEGKVITCENGSVPASNNETCVICTEGTYHNTEMGKCENCPRNFYQDQNQQITCKPCSGSVKIFTVSEGSNSQSQCVSECSTNPNYCKNGGKCNFNDVTIWCTCKERYSGSRCGEQAEYTSDTPYIIGGTVGGLAAIMVVALVIICLIRCLKRSKESTSKYPPSEPMEYFYDYNTPFYDNSSKRGGISSHARMNPAFNYDDGSFYDTRNRMYPQEDDDYRGYRWQEARGDFDL